MKSRKICLLKQTEHSRHSEVRQEAVQQALAALKNRPKPSLPMPSKRSSVFNRSPERGDENDSGKIFCKPHRFVYCVWPSPSIILVFLLDSTSEESNPEGIPTPDHDVGYNLPRDHIVSTREQLKLPSSSRNHISSKTDSDHRRSAPQASDTSSAGSPPAHGRKVVAPGYDYATEMSDLSLAVAGRSNSTFYQHFLILI